MSAKIKAKVEEYYKKWLVDGHKMTDYACNHCFETIPTPQPGTSMVSKKGYWDSVQICPKCGKLNFVKVYPSGETEAIEL